MKKGKYDLDRLEHILNSCAFILEDIKGIDEDEFYRNQRLKYAVLKHIEIIGEAANFLSDELQEQNPQVPWAQLIGLRNRSVHTYFAINWVTIWEIVQDEIQDTKDKVAAIRNSLKNNNNATN